MFPEDLSTLQLAMDSVQEVPLEVRDNQERVWIRSVTA